jgi:hypothetical protein
VFGKAFFQLPLPDGRTPAVTENNRCLPAVPSSIAMVLTGFLCISLVRDRKVWLTLIAGLLAIGQAGIDVLPELSSRLSRKAHVSRLIEPTLTALCPLSHYLTLDGCRNKTLHAGLFPHFEAIPRHENAFTNNHSLLSLLCPGVAEKNISAFQYAIIHVQLALSKLSNCLVSGTGQFVCFSPISCFNLRPRGPPAFA